MPPFNWPQRFFPPVSFRGSDQVSSAVRDQRWRKKQRGWIHTARMLLLLVMGRRRGIIAVYLPPQKGNHSLYQSLEQDIHQSAQQQQQQGSHLVLGDPPHIWSYMFTASCRNPLWHHRLILIPISTTLDAQKHSSFTSTTFDSPWKSCGIDCFVYLGVVSWQTGVLILLWWVTDQGEPLSLITYGPKYNTEP